MPYLLGVDGGGTKTVAVITDMEGHILGWGESGPANLSVVPEKPAARSLRKAVSSALKDAGKRLEEVSAAGFGLAGCDPERNPELAHRILRAAFPGLRYVFHHDAAIALIAGAGEDFGVIVIAGTGAIAYGKNRAGQEGRAGGWGPLLGDEGSAYDIALTAIRAAIHAQDGRARPTALRDALLQHLSLRDLWDLIPMMHGGSLGRTEIAALAPLVAQVAREGDKTARRIFQQAGEHLAALAIAIIRRLKLSQEPFYLATIGGVFQAGDLFLDRFTGLIRAEAPYAGIGPPRFEPAVGAALMARIYLVDQR